MRRSTTELFMYAVVVSVILMGLALVMFRLGL